MNMYTTINQLYLNDKTRIKEEFIVQNQKLNDLHNNIKKEVDKILKKYKLQGQANRKINENDIGWILLKACDIVYIDYSVEKDMSVYTYAIYNPKVQGYVRDTNFLNDLIQLIILNYSDYVKTTANKALKDVDNYIKHSKTEIRIANLPPQHLVKMQNCIVNLKTKETYDFDDEAVKDYDFIDSIRYSLYRPEDVDQWSLNVVKSIMKDWSQGKEDIEKFMRQIAFSFIEGDGRGVQIILKSEGGDGKSTFNRIISKLSDPASTVTINLDEYNDDNIMNKIQPSTKFIMGDDLSSNFSMSKKALARFKSLVDGGPINVNEKFMPSKTISSKALKVQNTNTHIKVFENNAAIKSRIILFEWPHYDFRQNPTLDFNLDNLSGKYGPANKKFMEAFLAYIIYYTEYFKKFSVTDKMKKDLEQALDDNDTILQHFYELEEMGAFKYDMLPYSVLYAHYKDWLLTTNPGSKPLKQVEYTKRMKQNLVKEGYNENTKRKIDNIDKKDFNPNLFANIQYDDSKRSNVAYRPPLNIEEHLDQFEKDLEQLDYATMQDKYSDRFVQQYINYLFEYHKTDIMIIFSKFDYTTADVLQLSPDQALKCLLGFHQMKTLEEVEVVND